MLPMCWRTKLLTGDGGGATVGVNTAKNQTAVTDVQTSDDLGSQEAQLLNRLGRPH